MIYKLNGSGWVLDRIDKLEIIIVNYTPFSSFKSNDGNLNISNDDQGGASEFNTGKYWRDKKGIVVPQKKKGPKCFLLACAIGRFKPDRKKGRITKQLVRQRETFNTEGIKFPSDRDDIRKFEKQNNLNIHCVCATTDSKHIELYKAAIRPSSFFC